QLRSSKQRSHQATLAILNANANPDAFRVHPTIPVYLEGCRRWADRSGYSLDEFWLHDPELNGARLNRILHARGISGVLVVGLMHQTRLPERFLPTWEE